VITGAGSGIGLAVARRQVARGDHVVGIGRTAEKLRGVAAELGGAFEPVVADVADADAVWAAFSALSSIDVLVTSAGICAQCRLDEPHAAGVWQRSIDTNLGGVFHCVRAASAVMPDGGSMVLVSSGLGRGGRAGYGAYAASKHGVLGLMRCVARELAPRGITVNAVCPGWVATSMSAADIATSADRAGVSAARCRARAVADIPIGRFVESAEVAALIDWLASAQACAITGQAYNICGGELAS
jgi:NAD(P)-dependent dehydrogenase (short-subunit alcohol dehydrogenase family)